MSVLSSLLNDLDGLCSDAGYGNSPILTNCPSMTIHWSVAGYLFAVHRSTDLLLLSMYPSVVAEQRHLLLVLILHS